MLSTSVNAWKLVSLTAQMSHEDEQPIGHYGPKSPDPVPTVYIEDYTLSFESGHPDYVLNIKDEENVTIYTTIVYSTQTLATLPSTLSGDYEIELLTGNWIFTGNIEL